MLQLSASLQCVSERIFHMLFEFLFGKCGRGRNRLGATCLAKIPGKRFNRSRLLVEYTAEIAVIIIGIEHTFSRIHDCLLGLEMC